MTNPRLTEAVNSSTSTFGEQAVPSSLDTISQAPGQEQLRVMGLEEDRAGRKAWQADAFKQSLISTHKAVIKKMASTPRTERFPKTINP